MKCCGFFLKVSGYRYSIIAVVFPIGQVFVVFQDFLLLPDSIRNIRGIKKRFPVLAKIAQGVFSLCASSTTSQTQFSKARKLANPWRNCCGHKSMSMQASLCLKSRYLMPELRDFGPTGQ